MWFNSYTSKWQQIVFIDSFIIELGRKGWEGIVCNPVILLVNRSSHNGKIIIHRTLICSFKYKGNSWFSKSCTMNEHDPDQSRSIMMKYIKLWSRIIFRNFKCLETVWLNYYVLFTTCKHVIKSHMTHIIY